MSWGERMAPQSQVWRALEEAGVMVVMSTLVTLKTLKMKILRTPKSLTGLKVKGEYECEREEV